MRILGLKRLSRVNSRLADISVYTDTPVHKDFRYYVLSLRTQFFRAQAGDLSRISQYLTRILCEMK